MKKGATKEAMMTFNPETVTWGPSGPYNVSNQCISSNKTKSSGDFLGMSQ